MLYRGYLRNELNEQLQDSTFNAPNTAAWNFASTWNFFSTFINFISPVEINLTLVLFCIILLASAIFVFLLFLFQFAECFTSNLFYVSWHVLFDCCAFLVVLVGSLLLLW